MYFDYYPSSVPVNVTDTRQVGKTTVLENFLGDTFSYVTLEAPEPYYVTRDVQAVPVWAI